MIRDILQNAGLVSFPELGLICFVLAFTLVLLKTFLLTTSEEHAAALMLPLDEDEVPTA